MSALTDGAASLGIELSTGQVAQLGDGGEGAELVELHGVRGTILPNNVAPQHGNFKQ